MVDDVILTQALELAQFTQRDAYAISGLDQEITQATHLGAFRQGNLDQDVDRFIACPLLYISQDHASQGHGQVIVYGSYRDSAPVSLLPIYHEMPVVVGLAHVVINVNQIGR